MFDLQMVGDKIVHELGTLIEQEVVMIDRNGYIIASTDAARIGEFHEGSLLAMQTREVMHMTYEHSKQLQGVREGMVMPLVIEGTAIGVIGVTGQPAEIEKYGKLVQKITQLFVEDFLRHQEQEREQRLFELFMLDMLNGSIKRTLLLQRAEKLQLNTELYDRIAIVHVERRFETNEVSALMHMQHIHPSLKIVQWSMDELVFLIPKVTREKLQQAVQLLLPKLEKYFQVNVQMGIGYEQSFEQLEQSYKQAKMALAATTKNTPLIFHEDLKLELLLPSISQELADEYLQRTLGVLLHDQELLANLREWLHSNGTLQDVAQKLHIHKNTLKYRLKKIERILGIALDERSVQMEMMVALALYHKFYVLS